MLLENNIRPISLLYMPILYGEINSDGKVIEKEFTQKKIKKKTQNTDFENGFFSQNTLMKCIKFKLKVVLNVPIEEKEQKEVIKEKSLNQRMK